MNQLILKVSYSAGAYNTGRVGRLSASSTESAHAAAYRLAAKVFGPALQSVVRVGDEQSLKSEWKATADADMWAWWTPDGTVSIGDTVPAGAIAIARGPDRALRYVLAVHVSLQAGAQKVDVATAVNKLALRNGGHDRFGVRFGFGLQETAHPSDWREKCARCSNLRVESLVVWRCAGVRARRSPRLMLAVDARRATSPCGFEAKMFTAKA